MSFGSSLRTGTLHLSEESLALLDADARTDILATVGAWVDYDTESDMLSVLELTKFVEDRRFVLSVELPELAESYSSQRSGMEGPNPGTWHTPKPSRDRLFDMSRCVAQHDTSMARALATEALDGGSDSSPQVGGGLIEEYTAVGMGLVRRGNFHEDGSAFDRDYSYADPDPDETIAISAPAESDSDGTSTGYVFKTAREAGYSDIDLDVDGCMSVFDIIGATEYRSISALRQLPDWAEWKKAVLPEIQHAVDVKRALTLRSDAEFRAARRQFRDRHEVLNLVTPSVVKHDADGRVLRRKFRITAADAKNRPGPLFDSETYSGAIDGATVHYLDNLTLGRNGKRRGLDVKRAYFKVHKTPPEAGGRSLWAPVPAGWDDLGYQTHATDGTRNWFEITGNVPGLRDAGRVWAADCDAFLLSEGFVQSIVDRRLFVKRLTLTRGERLFIVGVYVDDYWTDCADDAAWYDFYAKWSGRYTASAPLCLAGSDFCGTSYTPHPDGSPSLG